VNNTSYMTFWIQPPNWPPYSSPGRCGAERPQKGYGQTRLAVRGRPSPSRIDLRNRAASCPAIVSWGKIKKREAVGPPFRIPTIRFMVFPKLSPYGLDLGKGASADLQGFYALPHI